VSVEVRDLNHIEKCGLCKVMGPWLWDNLRILSFGLGQILMWGKHDVRFPVSKVKVTKFQCCELILVGTNYVHPFRKVRGDQSIIEVSRYTITIDGIVLTGETVHPSIERVELVWGCLNNPSRLEWTTLTSLTAPLATLRYFKKTKEKLI
jgi:hypothetical protein